MKNDNNLKQELTGPLVSRREVLATLGESLLMISVIAGCGGGKDNSGSSETSTGRATLTVTWPSRTTTRLIPTASDSIVVRFLQNGTVVATQIIARPDSGDSTTVTISALPVDTLLLQADAYPNADGSGVAQASATSNITIVAAQTTAVTLTLASTIDHLVVPDITIGVGQTAALILTALDASSNIVLITASKVNWTSQTPAVATVDSSGSVTGIALGTTQVTVTDTESGKSVVATVTVAVVTSSSPSPSPSPTPTPTPTPTPIPSPSPGTCTLIPQETQGPYPLLTVLSNASIVRSNITEGKTGVPLTLNLTFVNTKDGCSVLKNAAVYIWQCDKDGQYSGYSSNQNGNHSGETFLRGIQLTDANGQVSFTTIYPGWYAGRITHIHFQVYLNDNLNVTATATSQVAFPQAVTTAVYNSSLYAARGQNTSVTSFSQDNVFSDGTTYQMLTVTGDTTSGYTGSLVIGISGS